MRLSGDSKRVTTKAPHYRVKVGKTNQTIEINGKKYDAATGQRIISQQTSPANHHPAKKPVALSRTTKSAEAVHRSPALSSHQTHKKTQKSQTLHRDGLRKPVPTKPVKASSTAHKVVPHKPKPTLSSPLTKQLDIARVKRAEQIKRSNLVSKFGSDGARVQHPIEQPLQTRQVVNMEVRREPEPAKKLPLSPVQSVLESGLKNAQSHKQPMHNHKKSKSKKSKKSKLLSYAAGAAAVMLLGGFIAYQNLPNATMRYASARSGITASLPGYQPAGFSLNRDIEYNPGQITLEFSSNSDDRQFSITQKETTWNSESLYKNYVTAKGSQTQKYEDKGRTIYLYGENNATWVNGGIWYDLNGDSQLNSDQLIRIATSM